MKIMKKIISTPGPSPDFYSLLEETVLSTKTVLNYPEAYKEHKSCNKRVVNRKVVNVLGKPL